MNPLDQSRELNALLGRASWAIANRWRAVRTPEDWAELQSIIHGAALAVLDPEHRENLQFLNDLLIFRRHL